ncbi:MAG TPA: hypothetical protein VJB92_03835 [Candidatus Paceibacterota bacterium]
MPYEKIDLRNLKVLPLKERENKMFAAEILPLDFKSDFQSKELDALIAAIVEARLNNKEVIWFMGAHVLRQGAAWMIIDLMRRDLITHIAANGAVAIHDFEMAYQGATLEDVERYIVDGKFGNWDETGKFVNEAAKRSFHCGRGFGEALGMLIAESDFPFKHMSIFAKAYKSLVPATIHKGIGFDITDQHPSADFAAIGKASGDDFLIFAKGIFQLEGGVFVNLGSAVTGPEVYLKALSIARNLAKQEGREIKHFTTAVIDLAPLGDWQSNPSVVDWKKPGAMDDPRYYYRPLKSILVRTVKDGGKSHFIQGKFIDVIPALYAGLLAATKKPGVSGV